VEAVFMASKYTMGVVQSSALFVDEDLDPSVVAKLLHTFPSASLHKVRCCLMARADISAIVPYLSRIQSSHFLLRFPSRADYEFFDEHVLDRVYDSCSVSTNVVTAALLFTKPTRLFADDDLDVEGQELSDCPRHLSVSNILVRYADKKVCASLHLAEAIIVDQEESVHPFSL
jgi:hypothetical protein